MDRETEIIQELNNMERRLISGQSESSALILEAIGTVSMSVDAANDRASAINEKLVSILGALDELDTRISLLYNTLVQWKPRTETE